MANNTVGFRNKPVDTSRFAMIPRADVPRSVFGLSWNRKHTQDADYLVPCYLEDVLPGDSFDVNVTAFARMATPLFPIMDDLFMDAFFFFVPYRLLWEHWERFMGAREPDPDSPTDYTVPQVYSLGESGSSRGFVPLGVGDYLGFPVQDGMATAPLYVSALPFRAYNLIYNDWFRDENLIDSAHSYLGDSAESENGFPLLKRAKVHDYFTSALPWPQKGPDVTLGLAGNAPVTGVGVDLSGGATGGPYTVFEHSSISPVTYADAYAGGTYLRFKTVTGGAGPEVPDIYADLSQVSGVTINALRLAAQTQALLERDARGGTRYTEIVLSHFGVRSPDARLQRPEYLGGCSERFSMTPVAQTVPDVDSPQGHLAGIGTGVSHCGFRQSFVEHGLVLGLLNIRSIPAYQQGIRRQWSRQTRYDFPWPAFANIGEQAVLRSEIYATGVAADDNMVFGYQERYAEMRYHPSEVCGYFRSRSVGARPTLDAWHLAQYYSAPPVLNQAFVEQAVPVERVVAAGALAAGQEFLVDMLFSAKYTRPLPAFGVPTLGGRL